MIAGTYNPRTDRYPGVAPGFYLPYRRTLGDATTSTTGWLVVGGLLLAAIGGAFALGATKMR